MTYVKGNFEEWICFLKNSEQKPDLSTTTNDRSIDVITEETGLSGEK